MSYRLLIAEGDQALGRRMEEKFRREGYRLHRTIKSDEAFDIATCDGLCDLVLVDADLAGERDAYELVDAVSLSNAPKPVIFLTGQASDEEAREYMRRGGGAYVDKESLSSLGPLVNLVGRAMAMERRNPSSRLSQVTEVLYMTGDEQASPLLTEQEGVYVVTASNYNEALIELSYHDIDVTVIDPSLPQWRRETIQNNLPRFFPLVPIISPANGNGTSLAYRHEEELPEQVAEARQLRRSRITELIGQGNSHVYGLTGATGSGKDTIAALLARMLRGIIEVPPRVNERRPRPYELYGERLKFVEPGSVTKEDASFAQVFTRTKHFPGGSRRYEVGIEREPIRRAIKGNRDLLQIVAEPHILNEWLLARRHGLRPPMSELRDLRGVMIDADAWALTARMEARGSPAISPEEARQVRDRFRLYANLMDRVIENREVQTIQASIPGFLPAPVLRRLIHEPAHQLARYICEVSGRPLFERSG